MDIFGYKRYILLRIEIFDIIFDELWGPKQRLRIYYILWK